MALPLVSTTAGLTALANSISVTHVQISSTRIATAAIAGTTSLTNIIKSWDIQGVAQAVLGQFQITAADVDLTAAYSNINTWGLWAGDPTDSSSTLLAIYSTPVGTSYEKVAGIELAARLFWTVTSSQSSNLIFSAALPLFATEARGGLVEFANATEVVDVNEARRAISPLRARVLLASWWAALTIAAAKIPALPASKITSGVFAIGRIPGLTAGKITSGTLHVDRIPALPATKINTGVFNTARIPGIGANKIISGTLGVNRIPSLSASKITSDTINIARLPKASKPQAEAGADESTVMTPLRTKDAINALIPSGVRTIYISTLQPTASDWAPGDVWLVREA